MYNEIINGNVLDIIQQSVNGKIVKSSEQKINDLKHALFGDEIERRKANQKKKKKTKKGGKRK